MKFLIYAPPYQPRSAGLRVMYRLCHLLRKCGADAYMSSGTSKWDTPIAKDFDKENDVVIYPEITHGNPVGAKKVVRYVLYFPGVNCAGPKTYDTDELVVYYDPAYKASAEVAIGRELTKDHQITISAYEKELFYPEKKYDYSVGFVGKGDSTVCVMPPCEALITYDWPAAREETARILRGATNLYTYDKFTALQYEAFLCGTNVFIPTAHNGVSQWTKWEPTPDVLATPDWDDLTHTRRLIKLVADNF